MERTATLPISLILTALAACEAGSPSDSPGGPGPAGAPGTSDAQLAGGPAAGFVPGGDPCAGLACPQGQLCASGHCAPDPATPAPCLPSASIDVLPSFGRAAADIVIEGGLAFVATALGLEVWPADENASEPIGWLPLEGAAAGLAVQGQLLAVSHGAAGVTLVDISDPAAPLSLGRAWTRSMARGMALTGSLLYVAESSAGLSIYDVSDPWLPIPLGLLPVKGVAHAVALAGDLAYLAIGHEGMLVVDVTDPTSPRVLSGHATGGEAVALTLAGERLYVSASYGGVRIFGVADPAAPELLGTYALQNNTLIARDVALDASETVAYVAATYFHTLHVLDVSDPAATKVLGTVDTSSGAQAIALHGSHAWLAGGTIQVCDVSDPAKPSVLSVIGNGSAGQVRDSAAESGRIYLAASEKGLQIASVTGADSPAMLGALAFDHLAMSVAIKGSIAYVGLDTTVPMVLSGKVALADVSAPSAPKPLGSVPVGGRPERILAHGDILYVSAGNLHIIDASVPGAPQTVGTIDASSSASGLAISGDLLVVTRRYKDLRLYDVSVPSSPKLLGVFDTPGNALDVALVGTTAFVADAFAGVRVIDVKNPKAPVEVASIELSVSATRVSAFGDRVWTIAGTGARLLDVAEPSRPRPLIALPSFGGSPTAIIATAEGVYLSDHYVPVALVTLGCQ